MSGVQAAVAVGIAAGVALVTLGYAEADSYLGDDPAACANCHIMRDVFDGWSKSSHRAVAVCNDCHAPHATLPKYATKAWNGLRHSLAFTTGDYPEPIRITAFNRAVTEGQCRSCHGALTHGLDEARGAREDVACTSCHARAGHR